MRFSIILPAYKESNINKTVELLLKQSLSTNTKLNKIFVVVCGYGNFSFLKHKKIRVIKEDRRRGKAYAINLALKKINLETESDIVILQSADTFPNRSMLKNLLKPFEDLSVGMTCGRPISLDDPKKFLGFANNLIWDLHHLISLDTPKVGEVLAFRNVIKEIPKKLATDEAYIESLIRKRGCKIAYAPNAIVFNRGAKTISDFTNQRRRIFTGHLQIRNKYKYEVSTMSTARLAKAIIEYFKIKSIKGYKQMVWLLYAVFLEAFARLLGTIDFYVFNKVPYMWEIVKTSGR